MFGIYRCHNTSNAEQVVYKEWPADFEACVIFVSFQSMFDEGLAFLCLHAQPRTNGSSYLGELL